MGRLAFLALAFLGVLLLRADAQPERRVALVIGNGAYQESSPLANPVNDAVDLAAKLREIGFEVVEGHDLGKRDLERKIGEFSDALGGAGVGLFFYAGHGIQVDGRNFIVPVDARLDVPAKLKLEAVPMDDVVDIIEQQAKTSIIFLDACRNNPFTRSLTTTSRAARALPGLAQFDSTRGSFIAFSTAPGSVAMDGAGRNSPFAGALLKHIDVPGQSINDLMIEVRRDVMAQTREQQRPWDQASLIERFEFVPAAGAAASTAAAKPAPASSLPAEPQQQVATLERSVGDTEAIESFIRDSYLLPDANAMRETVRKLYADNPTIYGTPYGFDALVKVKSDWFAQFASWRLGLLPGSLVVTPRGDSRADVAFAMSYDYEPKDKAVGRMTGKAKVMLGLELTPNGWQITSEASEAMP